MNIEDYKGLAVLSRLENPLKKELYLVNWTQLYINYGDNVEWQRLKNQILLTDETREYLAQPPKKPNYIKGSRPILEKYVSDAIKGATTDREKVLAIMCFCRDLYKKDDRIVYYGGTEEQLIEKGENLCECLGRLMVGLCEIAGFAGRIVMHLAGHITCEIFFEGRWAYFDPRGGIFYLNESNEFLSVDEIVRNRHYLDEQSDYVRSFVSGKWTYEQRQKQNKEHYMTEVEMQCFCPYTLEDEYNYEIKTTEQADYDGLWVINRRYDELIEMIYK